MSTKGEGEIISTKVAYAYWDEHAFCGYRLFADLLGHISAPGLLLLSLTGRRPSAEECALVDDIITIVTMADPRIWPLKICRIIGAYGRFLPAFAAGYLSVDGADIGPSVCGPLAERLRELYEGVGGRVDDVSAVEDCVRKLLATTPRLPGFGVPFRSPDERLVALRGRVKAHGRHERPFWRLLECMTAVIRREKNVEPNVGAGLVAVLLDLGFEPNKITPLVAMFMQMTFIANAMEGAAEPAASLRALPLDRIDYVGREGRESPRAHASRASRP